MSEDSSPEERQGQTGRRKRKLAVAVPGAEAVTERPFSSTDPSFDETDRWVDPAEGDGVARWTRPGAPVPEPPARFGRYEVLGELGRGGMARVLAGWDPKLRRAVALKVLRDPTNREHAARFIAEARTSARLEHPNILPVHDVGTTTDGRLFLVMKRIEGDSLQAVLSQMARCVREGRPIPSEWSRPRLLLAFAQVCRAVGFAHGRGRLHRDLKPGNILLGSFGEVLLFDWGLSTAVGSGGARGDDLDLTRPGMVVGTPGFLSPERLSGDEEPDERSDVWSLGVILYQLITLRRAFRGKTPDEVVAAVFDGPPDPHSRSPGWWGNRGLADLCAHAMQPLPADRLRSASVLGEQVEQLISVGSRNSMAAGDLEEAERRCAELEALADSMRNNLVTGPARRGDEDAVLGAFGEALSACSRASAELGSVTAAAQLQARVELAVLRMTRTRGPALVERFQVERMRRARLLATELAASDRIGWNTNP